MKVNIIGIDPVNSWLDRKHAREHIVVWPMRCENCEHKFSVSRSEDTMPPWADED